MTVINEEPTIRLELGLTERVGPLVIVRGDALDGRQLCCLRPGRHPMQKEILLQALA